MRIESYDKNRLIQAAKYFDGNRSLVYNFCYSGQLESQQYFHNEKIHREADLPAFISWYATGQLMYCEYIQNNLHHRNNTHGPARIWWWKNGKLEQQEYYLNGELHRYSNLPALISWYESGQLEMQQYYENGQRHRATNRGAACICWYKNGRIKRKDYWVYGQHIRELSDRL